MSAAVTDFRNHIAQNPPYRAQTVIIGQQDRCFAQGRIEFGNVFSAAIHWSDRTRTVRAEMGALMLDVVRSWFSVPRDNPELLRAQYAAFSKQVPLLYTILVINTWGLATTHIGLAPDWLAILLPTALTLVCIIRCISWWRSRSYVPSSGEAYQALTRTNRLTAILGVMFVAWSLSLYSYGNAYTQSHIAFFMGITVVSCIFCLMHLRAAALSLMVLVNVPFVLFFSATGNPTFIATSINVALVSVAMLIILNISYRDFTHLIASRKALLQKQGELEQKQVETQALSDENFRLANLDALTDLPNRRSFFFNLEQSFAKARETDTPLVLGILDLDGFKPVNDAYGHGVGDLVLVEVAQRLRDVCGSDITPYRLAGDEFALMVGTHLTEDVILEKADRICALLRMPYPVTNGTAQISASIGFSALSPQCRTAHDLFEQADYALYDAKRGSGRGKAHFFSAAHQSAILQNIAIEHALINGNLEDELYLEFQPIVEAGNGLPMGFEALARWRSPTLGQISPGLFIPVAERAGLISKLTRLLLAKALHQAGAWPAPLRLSFNLSVHDLSIADGLLPLISIITASGFDPRRLDLEITETAMMRDFAQATQAIDTLKSLGVGISLDDFGTGYSSLTQVHRVPLDKIKIDRSFVVDIDKNPASHKIVKSLVALCRDMDLSCVVEGVETEEELKVLRELGCDLIQGFYFARPLSVDSIAGFLAGPERIRA